MDDERFKKLSDRNWRLNNLYQIIDKNARLIQFKENPIQKKIRRVTARRKNILKARQFGVTTHGVLRLFDRTIWSPNQTTCILAHKRELLDKIFNIVKIAYKGLPDELKPTLDRGGGSKYEYIFPEINSKIYTALEVRGGTIHELHISEGAFIPEDRISATLQAVKIGNPVTIETTPNGLNHFYDSWNLDNSGYRNLFFPWFMHPEYKLETVGRLILSQEELDLSARAKRDYNIKLSDKQIAFRRFKINEFKGNTLKFLREYPEDPNSCFLASGNNPFDASLIKEKMDQLPAAYKRHGEILLADEFDKNKTYVIGADPAEGVKRDYSVAVCVCVEDRKTVAFCRGHYDTSTFPELIYKMGKLFSISHRFPVAIIERNNHGHAVILKLIETLNYPNLWMDDDEKPGHRTTSMTRPLVVDLFIESVANGTLDIKFKDILAECLTLVDNNGKIEAEDGKHDDSVIATALATKVMSETYHKIGLYRNIESRILS